MSNIAIDDRKTSRAVLLCILSMFIIGLVVELSTLWLWDEFSTGGLFTWVIGIGLAILWKKGSIDTSALLFFSWLLGMLLGLSVCVLMGFYYSDLLHGLSSYASSMRNGISVHWVVCEYFYDGMLVLTGSEGIFSANTIRGIFFFGAYVFCFGALGWVIGWVISKVSGGRVNPLKYYE